MKLAFKGGGNSVKCSTKQSVFLGTIMEQRMLGELADMLAKKISSAAPNDQYFSEPFKHVVIDDFFPLEFAQGLSEAIDLIPKRKWDYTCDDGIEVKYRTNWQSEFDIPDSVLPSIRLLNSSPILKAMSERLKIPKLMPDPYFTGGGLNMTEKGGHLDVHVDGNYHDASGLNRRVNILVYLTEGWQPDWGGEFGIYSDGGDKLSKSVSPLFNRCVIFDTHDQSFHGLPNPINFPDGHPRKSILLYYYTKEPRPSNQVSVENPHSALWKSRGFTDKRGNKTRDYE